HRLAQCGETQAAAKLGDGTRGGGRFFLNFRLDFRLDQSGAGNRTVGDERQGQQKRLQRSATPALENVENGVEQRGVHGVRTGLLAPSFACRTYRQPLILLDRGQGKVNAIRARRGRWGVTIYIVAGHFGREEKREKRGLNWAG